MRRSQDQKKIDIIRFNDSLSDYFDQLAEQLRQENVTYHAHEATAISHIRDLELT